MSYRVAFSTIALILGMVAASCGGSSTSTSAEADRTPDQILGDAATAISKVTTYHFVVDTTQTGSALHLDLHVGGPGKVTGSLTTEGLNVDIVVTGSDVYLRGGKDFWTKFGGAAAAALVADKWVKVPSSATDSITKPLGMFADTSEIAKCLLTAPHGTVTKSTTTVDGQAVIELRDAGDQPGTEAGTLDIAASGPPYPVRLVTDGNRKPGGATPPPDCSTSSSSSSSSASSTSSGAGGSVTFKEWGAPVTVTPPPDALDLSKLGG